MEDVRENHSNNVPQEEVLSMAGFPTMAQHLSETEQKRERSEGDESSNMERDTLLATTLMANTYQIATLNKLLPKGFKFDMEESVMKAI